MTDTDVTDDTDDTDDDLADLLPDDLTQPTKIPVKRTKKQQAAAERAAREKQEAHDLAVQQTAAKEHAARLAQVVNLHIAGFSLAEIGASIGASADEVDRMLANDTQRYVRNQPALRTYVRNFVSGKYTSLLEAVWDEATDKTHPHKLENQDRALRILDRMARLHGAEAPVQSEVKVDAAPEAVEALVNALAQGHGLGYDVDVFDVEVISDETVHEAVQQTHAALESSSHEVEQPQPEDGEGL